MHTTPPTQTQRRPPARHATHAFPRGLPELVKRVGAEAQQDARLAHAAVADEQQLEEVVEVLRHGASDPNARNTAPRSSRRLYMETGPILHWLL